MMCMNKEYAGFYKNYYLRSSYEYAYAKYLNFHKNNGVMKTVPMILDIKFINQISFSTITMENLRR